MNYKDIQEEYIIIKAYTQSETESCDYVLIKEGLAFIENLRKRAKGIELLKEKRIDFAEISFREDYDDIIFYKKNIADKSILKDREEDFIKLKKRNWVIISLSDNELAKLNPTPIQKHLCYINSFITEDGYFGIKAEGEFPEDIFYTEMVRIKNFLEDTSLNETYKNKEKELIPLNITKELEKIGFNTNTIVSPTCEQAFDWFKKEIKLDYSITFEQTYIYNKLHEGWVYKFQASWNKGHFDGVPDYCNKGNWKFYETYEAAQIGLIENLIELYKINIASL